jgi:hypothetical protein
MTPDRQKLLRRVIDRRFLAGPGLGVVETPDSVTYYAVSERKAVVSGSGVNSFFAKLTVSVQVATHKWAYHWEEVAVTFNGVVPSAATLEDPRTHITNGFAYNLHEMMNTGANVEGNSINVSGSSFPDTFTLQPAGGITYGHNDVVVLLTQHTQDNGDPWCSFTYVNQVDGTCPEP